jgi:hypothetical protein
VFTLSSATPRPQPTKLTASMVLSGRSSEAERFVRGEEAGISKFPARTTMTIEAVSATVSPMGTDAAVADTIGGINTKAIVAAKAVEAKREGTNVTT